MTKMRGSGAMIKDIEEAILDACRQPIDSPAPAWMGAFTRMDILITVKGCSEDCLLSFEIGASGRLQWISEETELVA